MFLRRKKSQRLIIHSFILWTMKIIVKGNPIAKQRPRIARFKKGDTSFVRMYSPKKTVNYETLIKMKAGDVINHPFEGPIKLTVSFYLSRPKRLIHKTKHMTECYTDKKPDIENLVKAVMDGLNGVAYHDDSQVVELIARKKYHAMDNEKFKTTEVKESLTIIEIESMNNL